MDKPKDKNLDNKHNIPKIWINNTNFKFKVDDNILKKNELSSPKKQILGLRGIRYETFVMNLSKFKKDEGDRKSVV